MNIPVAVPARPPTKGVVAAVKLPTGELRSVVGGMTGEGFWVAS